MNVISRTITGIIMVFVGLTLIGMSFFLNLLLLIYGILILIIGFVILFNKKEDKIELIKSKRRRK